MKRIGAHNGRGALFYQLNINAVLVSICMPQIVPYDVDGCQAEAVSY